MRKFSEAEIEALRMASQSSLFKDISEKTERCGFEIIPGIRVFQKLEKEGLLYITEEDLIFEDDPDFGTWTPSVELTEEGKKVFSQLR